MSPKHRLILPSVIIFMLLHHLVFPAALTHANSSAVHASEDEFVFDPWIKERVKARGIYVSSWMAASDQFDQLVELVEKTELNSMVIDVKDDNGLLTYRSEFDEIKRWNQHYKPLIPDMAKWLSKLKEKNIYVIARIVTFKDSNLARQQPEWALQKANGELWHDRQNNYWLDPYHEKAWEYNLNIAKEAAKLGFDEIQFDYVRFPENEAKVDQEVVYKNSKQWSKPDNIMQFLKQARKELHGYPVFISADVFGLTTSSADDMGIGQDWKQISETVDYICPMVYPSHYSEGSYGIHHPDLHPYRVVRKAMLDALNKNSELMKKGANAAIIRPWFQSFSATWMDAHQIYHLKQIEEQIKAASELGIDEYLLWNARSNYDVLQHESIETKK